MCVLQKRQVLEEAEMLDPRISALEEDLDEVESSEEEDEEEEKVVTVNEHRWDSMWKHKLIITHRHRQIFSYMDICVFPACSQRDSKPLNPTDAVIATMTDLVALPRLVTGAAALPDGVSYVFYIRNLRMSFICEDKVK